MEMSIAIRSHPRSRRSSSSTGIQTGDSVVGSPLLHDLSLDFTFRPPIFQDPSKFLTHTAGRSTKLFGNDCHGARLISFQC